MIFNLDVWIISAGVLSLTLVIIFYCVYRCCYRARKDPDDDEQLLDDSSENQIQEPTVTEVNERLQPQVVESQTIHKYYSDGSYDARLKFGVAGYLYENRINTKKYHNVRNCAECEVLAATMALKHAKNKIRNTQDIMFLYTDNSKVKQLFAYLKECDQDYHPEFINEYQQVKCIKIAVHIAGHSDPIGRTIDEEQFSKVDERVNGELRSYKRRHFRQSLSV
ncbi:unnamed protein product [Didymodactylos carnosus]|uniref:RNase H type-1 domain-containing protein n=1 Tax=Didymodactylos carnosus TaxID=1234261 RepID=A0A814LCY3_9BILA|nr:unnamed protein product [Didymodactylos carnosus]CAF1063294.1 unnamed protein product [Didymodactylos carnosus]CAF3785027.1 unnamed protein product [Didymodactylos carnosus]CAF3831341.1 unnamed protein product [Didymodactylos carnosus]